MGIPYNFLLKGAVYILSAAVACSNLASPTPMPINLEIKLNKESTEISDTLMVPFIRINTDCIIESIDKIEVREKDGEQPVTIDPIFQKDTIERFYITPERYGPLYYSELMGVVGNCPPKPQ